MSSQTADLPSRNEHDFWPEPGPTSRTGLPTNSAKSQGTSTGKQDRKAKAAVRDSWDDSDEEEDDEPVDNAKLWSDA